MKTELDILFDGVWTGETLVEVLADYIREKLENGYTELVTTHPTNFGDIELYINLFQDGLTVVGWNRSYFNNACQVKKLEEVTSPKFTDWVNRMIHYCKNEQTHSDEHCDLCNGTGFPEWWSYGPCPQCGVGRGRH